MKTLTLLLGLCLLAGCGGTVSPMRLESRTPDTAKSQEEINREMIDAARKRERMTARGE